MIKIKIEISCKHCDNTVETSVPIDTLIKITTDKDAPEHYKLIRSLNWTKDVWENGYVCNECCSSP